MEYKIIPLPKEKWKGTPIMLKYTTTQYYDLAATAGDGFFNIQLVKKPFDAPVTHSPEDYDFPDKLYQDHWQNAQAFGIVDESDGREELLACIEICPEEWSNRLMVTELWVADHLHRRGIGTRLMNIAKEQAALQGRRAIAFYLSQGFELIGYDSCCYTNNDVQRREVRLDLGFFLHRREERR